MRISVCLLAAGKSSRFNGEKLLHKIGEKTLTEHVLDKINTLTDNDSICFLKTVITKPKLFDFYQQTLSKTWTIINNKSFQEGLSTSVKCAVYEAIRHDADGMLLFLADMPLINQTTINSVIEHFQRFPQKIIRPVFNRQPGFPVAFPKLFFEPLTHLTGDVGAKPVIERHKEHLIQFHCKDSGSIFDIDEDIRRKKE